MMPEIWAAGRGLCATLQSSGLLPGSTVAFQHRSLLKKFYFLLKSILILNLRENFI